MATNTHTRSGAAISLVALLAALVAATAQNATTHRAPLGNELDSDEIGLMGFAGHVPDSKKPKVTAYFEQESYRPGDQARLVVTDTAPQVSVQIFRTGTEAEPTVPNDVMLGTPVTKIVPVGAVHGRRALSIHIADWPSGVYFAQLTAPGARVGYAPFVLAPRHLGEHRVAVVMPTQTWQAYNFRDDNGDGQPDAPYVRWLVQTHRNVDYLSDAELRNVRNGKTLADAYSLIVFSGHHEYVTTHEYDVVSRYRDFGGNLAFLAANNFFWKITIKHNVMTRVAQWRDLGRPEAALIGVQYRGNDRGGHRGPWLVRGGAEATPWLFNHMSTTEGVGSGGIEIDATSSASPKNIHILAEIPNLYGPGFTAQMTYYETPAGAKVFAAGAFSLAGSVWEPEMETLMTNLWGQLSNA
jgi:hypothetical protein